MNEIADVKSLLETSTQTTKELKTRLNGLAEKKKDAGKSPRKIHAPSNRFDTPVPKIQGLSGLIETMSLATTTNKSLSASDSDVASGQPLDDSEMRNDSEVQVNDNLKFNILQARGSKKFYNRCNVAALLPVVVESSKSHHISSS